MEFGTKVLHGYEMLDLNTGASSVAIAQTSTFHQKDIEANQEYTYTRFGNPTRAALENAVAALENCRYGLAFASGMAAITSVLLIFSQGDHIIICKDVYGGTCKLAKTMLTRFGMEISFVDVTDAQELAAAIRPNTKCIYIETPSNPLLKVTDIRKVADFAKQHGILTVIDNTFMSPQFQNPIQLGVDIVIHSATKFLNGHSDVLLGVVVTDNEALYKQLKDNQIMIGALPGPQDCWLAMRGLKTMNVRMRQSAASALAIATYLSTHPKVKSVNYPGLKTHPGYEVQMQQAGSGGCVLSFELESYEAVKTFFANVKIPIVAVSLGGVESILSYPVTMSHACVSESDRLAQGITPGLIRLSVGIEDEVDLLADLEAALATI